MDPYVIIATKGRPRDVYELLTVLQQQTLLPVHTFVVGADSADLAGLQEHPAALAGHVTLQATGKAGLTLQRNAGVNSCRQRGAIGASTTFVIFFDDDFRPATTWLEQARNQFISEPGVAGLTGHVLADGVHGHPFTTATAQPYLDGTKPPEPHWASGDAIRTMDCLYGCNMAFRGDAMAQCSFDETLPLYGWQEDQDYSSQISRYGRLIYTPDCKGVHLGSASGRTSGVKLGYSQIVNPIYLIRKGTMARRKAYRFIARHLVANTVKSFINHPRIDYPGRLKGNLRAVFDLARGDCDPRKVTQLS